MKPLNPVASLPLASDTRLCAPSASGLGLATVHELLKANAYVSILDRLTPPIVNESESDSSGRVFFVKTDITKVEEVESAVERTVSWTEQTGAPLGGVVNAAGIANVERVRRYLAQYVGSSCALMLKLTLRS